jgi:hypothetical protein
MAPSGSQSSRLTGSDGLLCHRHRESFSHDGARPSFPCGTLGRSTLISEDYKCGHLRERIAPCRIKDEAGRRAGVLIILADRCRRHQLLTRQGACRTGCSGTETGRPSVQRIVPRTGAQRSELGHPATASAAGSATGGGRPEPAPSHARRKTLGQVEQACQGVPEARLSGTCALPTWRRARSSRTSMASSVPRPLA